MVASYDHANGVETLSPQGTTHTVNYPTTVEGEWLTVFCSFNGVSTVTPPTGITWTQMFFDNTGNATLGVWRGKQVASPLTSESWESNLSRQGTWWVMEATGVDATNPSDVIGTPNADTSNAPTHGGVTPSVVDTVAAYVHSVRAQNAGNLTPPSGWTKAYDGGTTGGGSSTMYVAFKELTTTDPIGSTSPSTIPSSTPWVSNIFTLKPAAAATSGRRHPIRRVARDQSFRIRRRESGRLN